MHGVSGCASGNCNNGSGEYLKAYPAANPRLESMSPNPEIELMLYIGKFSDDGKKFEGTVYSRTVYYDVVYKKDEPKLVPKVREDLKSEAFWKGYEVASGTMAKWGSSDYRWNGWMESALPQTATTTAGQTISFKAHFIDDKAHIKKKFAPGGVYDELEGKALKNGEFLGGRIRFSDGSLYEGFVYKGKRFGPGRYTTKDGKKEEGLWMLDSLAMPMAVSLPKDLFEPVLDAPVVAKLDYGGAGQLDFMDAGGGWVYSFYSNIFYMGKWENGKLNGPGFMVSDNKFRTGIFAEGKLSSGMKVINDVYIPSGKEGTTVITGEFKDDQVKSSCSKMIRYDAKGKPVYMAEGYFYPSQNFGKEFADGWAYINDWEGKREAANLQYLYSGESYLAMNGDPGYVTWFTKGLKESETAVFCFPSMKAQSAPILARMKLRHDSVVVFANKKAADMAAYNEAWKKREVDQAVACAAERAKYNYAIGDLFVVDDAVHSPFFLITGPVDCILKAYPVHKRVWIPTTGTKGYWRVSETFINGEQIKKAKNIGASHAICGNCGGAGSIHVTEYHEVGGNSGYTSVGGGWVVKNPETYWKSETMVACSKCYGKGFIPRK